MNSKKKKIFLLVLGIFLIIFLIKFFWEFGIFEKSKSANYFGSYIYSGSMKDSSLRIGNVASTSVVFQAPGFESGQILEQKYEKTTNISAESSSFDEDEKKTRSIIENFSAIIQFENSSGLEGERLLSLVIGVKPESFQALSDALFDIAKPVSLATTKTDRTNDYRTLLASKKSLEKTRDGLVALRIPGATLSDLVNLEIKIMEIEEKIQSIAVSLGNFTEEESLSTIQYEMMEIQKVNLAEKIIGAALNALAWSIPVSLGLYLCALAALGVTLLILILLERFKAKGNISRE